MSAAAPLTFLIAPFRFVGSLTLGIILLVSLLVLLALGTLLESEYGSTVARFVIYDNYWFLTLLALLAINLSVSIILRFPWKLRHLPFILAHAGILVLLFGCCLTWKQGEEAQITLAEGTIGNVAVKPEQQQLECRYIGHSPALSPRPVRFPLSLGPFSWPDYQYANWIKEDRPYRRLLWHAMKSVVRTTRYSDEGLTIEILDYYAHSAIKPVPPFDVSVLWNQTVEGVPRNWESVRLDMRHRHGIPGMSGVRGVSGTMSQGERVSYGLAQCREELAAFQGRKSGEDTLWGEIVLYYGGNHYSVSVDRLIALPEDGRLTVEGSGLQIGDVRFSDRGPIIRLSVFVPGGDAESMVLMPDNPELNVQARKLGIFGSYWLNPHSVMQQSPEHADHPMLHRLTVPRLDFMQGTDKKLYYRLWSGADIVADGVVPDRAGQNKPQFKVAERTPYEAEIVIDQFLPQDVPGGQIVPVPISRNQQQEPRLQLRVVCDGNEETFWLRAAPPTVVPLPPEPDQIRYLYGNARTLSIQFNCETIDLGFGILLKQFEKRTEPGTRMPAHYASLVDYVEPIDSRRTVPAFSRDLAAYRPLPGGENVWISMNRPGYFAGRGQGYRIYQSSYLGPFYPDQPQFYELYDGAVFPWETRPRESIALSTLSVNADPGRGWKYLGSFLIVLGAALLIWRKSGGCQPPGGPNRGVDTPRS